MDYFHHHPLFFRGGGVYKSDTNRPPELPTIMHWALFITPKETVLHCYAHIEIIKPKNVNK